MIKGKEKKNIEIFAQERTRGVGEARELGLGLITFFIPGSKCLTRSNFRKEGLISS